MPEGDFVVGRSSTCHLALDDALVSRRHAVFHVTPDGVGVEDLGSRNGVQVNGESIVGTKQLGHLDRIVIGAQELLLVRVQGEGAMKERGTRPTLAGMTLDLPVVKEGEPDEPTAGQGGSVLDRIADKALALGRFEEAERMLARRMKGMVLEARSSERKLSAEKRQAATEYALTLASGLSKGEWVDWIFEVHDASDALLTEDTIERLHELVRRIRYRGSPMFRQYVQRLRERSASLSKREQFLVRRLEGLERVVGA